MNQFMQRSKWSRHMTKQYLPKQMHGIFDALCETELQLNNDNDNNNI